jgi:hypothetical protein
VLSRQRDKLIALNQEERVGGDEDRAGLLLHQRCEGAVEVAFGAGAHDIEL